VKSQQDGILKQVVPELWKRTKKELMSCCGPFHQTMAIFNWLVLCAEVLLTKAISANTNYDPQKFESQKVPMKVILKDLCNGL